MLVSPLRGRPDNVRAVVDGRLMVITGASRGIGRELAIRLAACGAEVVGIARTEADLDQLATEIGGRFHPLAGDLRDTEWAGLAARQIVERFGTPSLLVSNAGHSIRRPLAEYTGRFHDIARTAGVNYLGAVALALPLLEAMMAQRSGHLISVATTSLDVPMPNWSAYTASKAAFEAWLDTVAPELAAGGVAVTSVHMQRVATAMSAPTAGRYNVPELDVGQAADLLCRAIVTRERLIAPWWARLGAVVMAGLPAITQNLWAAAWRAGLRP